MAAQTSHQRSTLLSLNIFNTFALLCVATQHLHDVVITLEPFIFFHLDCSELDFLVTSESNRLHQWHKIIVMLNCETSAGRDSLYRIQSLCSLLRAIGNNNRPNYYRLD